MIVLFVLQINPTSFYSHRKNRDLARPFLNTALSEDRDLSSESDESIYISESEIDYEDSSESIESHSWSDFSESNNKSMVKPNPLLQTKTGASKKTKRHWKSNATDVILMPLLLTLDMFLTVF